MLYIIFLLIQIIYINLCLFKNRQKCFSRIAFLWCGHCNFSGLSRMFKMMMASQTRIFIPSVLFKNGYHLPRRIVFHIASPFFMITRVKTRVKHKVCYFCNNNNFIRNPCCFIWRFIFSPKVYLVDSILLYIQCTKPSRRPSMAIWFSSSPE